MCSSKLFSKMCEVSKAKIGLICKYNSIQRYFLKSGTCVSSKTSAVSINVLPVTLNSIHSLGNIITHGGTSTQILSTWYKWVAYLGKTLTTCIPTIYRRFMGVDVLLLLFQVWYQPTVRWTSRWPSTLCSTRPHRWLSSWWSPSLTPDLSSAPSPAAPTPMLPSGKTNVKNY